MYDWADAWCVDRRVSIHPTHSERGPTTRTFDRTVYMVGSDGHHEASPASPVRHVKGPFCHPLESAALVPSSSSSFFTQYILPNWSPVLRQPELLVLQPAR